MSIMRCEHCDRPWDSDEIEACPRCVMCEVCSDNLAVANVEVFEVSGMVMCEDCGDQALCDVGGFA